MVFHPKKHPCSIRDFLKQHGLQRSKDRQSILARFQEFRTWSAAQLMENLPETQKSTIFRNLKLFEEKGIIVSVHLHDGAMHYELAERGHHDHVVCESCDVAECVDCPAPDLQAHTLELHGRCLSCA